MDNFCKRRMINVTKIWRLENVWARKRYSHSGNWNSAKLCSMIKAHFWVEEYHSAYNRRLSTLARETKNAKLATVKTLIQVLSFEWFWWNLAKRLWCHRQLCKRAILSNEGRAWQFPVIMNYCPWHSAVTSQFNASYHSKLQLPLQKILTFTVACAKTQAEIAYHNISIVIMLIILSWFSSIHQWGIRN